MSEDLINQLTLNCLISKTQLQKLNKKTKENVSQKKQDEINKYNDRIKMLFSDLLVCNPPSDLLCDVKSSFDIFIEKTIYYFKAHDHSAKLESDRSNNDIIHNDIDFEKEEREIERGDYEERNDDQELDDDDDMEDEELDDDYEIKDEEVVDDVTKEEDVEDQKQTKYNNYLEKNPFSYYSKSYQKRK